MKTLCWLRRDLRLHDNLALSQALLQGETTVVFIFDSTILDKLTHKNDQRVSFIYDSLKEIETTLQKKNSSLIILYGDPTKLIPELAIKLKIEGVFCNRDYEPYAKKRDSQVQKELEKNQIDFFQYKDSVIFEKKEILTNEGGIYKVFTPYKNKWLETFEVASDYECDFKNLTEFKNSENILDCDWYKKIAFIPTPPELPAGTKAGQKRLKEFSARINDYAHDRDFPAKDGTSLLSVYLRFGNISVRDMVRIASSQKWLVEIIWRDFYQMLLDAFPRLEKEAFKTQYEDIKWLGEKKHFELWCQGETGFPLIDAAMRCFFQTGMMHNRLRMVVASFLCKTLLIDWKKGEHYFAQKLLDFDLAANNGGWQWCSSSGADAQPYFRIFNPYTQSEKFDPQGEFIKKWVPELSHLSGKSLHRPTQIEAPDYPTPIVSYENNRRRCLAMYDMALKAK